MRTARYNRRGITALLAMIYLVLFSALAIGFYAATTMAVQVVSNENQMTQAMLAAESGMQFIRYHLAALNIPPTTPPNQLFSTVANQLAQRLSSYNGVVVRNNLLIVPPVTTDDGTTQFKIQMTQAGQQLAVKVCGYYGDAQIGRGIQMNYAIAQRASGIFDYGVASKSKITMQGNAKVVGATDPRQGSVLSTNGSLTPLTMAGNSAISGDVSFVNSAAWPSVGSNSTIAGSGDPGVWSQHVHPGVDMPDFPTIDTTAFVQYATDVYPARLNNSGGDTRTLINCVLPPGNYTFNGNMTIKGVLYVQTPCTIRFNGNLNIQGAIVVQNHPTGSTSTNTMNFAGNVSAQGMDTLPAGDPRYPDSLRALKGAFLLAPTFYAQFSGNFGTVSGSIIASKLDFSGNAGGTIKGSVVNLDDTSMNLAGNSLITIESQGTGQYPAGVFFGQNYVPLPDTYQEISSMVTDMHNSAGRAQTPSPGTAGEDRGEGFSWWVHLRALSLALPLSTGGGDQRTGGGDRRTGGATPLRARRGLSLVEVMISLAISAMLLAAVAAAYSASATVIENNDAFFRASQAARVTMNQLLTEIRRSQAVQCSSQQIDMIMYTGADRSYKYDSVKQKIMLITNDTLTDPDYTLASNVIQASFQADSEPDPVTQISRVVRITITLVVQVQGNQIRLSGSAVPRRALVY